MKWQGGLVVGETVLQLEGHMLDPRNSRSHVIDQDGEALSCFVVSGSQPQSNTKNMNVVRSIMTSPLLSF